MQGVRVDLVTREYPPHVYGGAGVHVTELAAVLRLRPELEPQDHVAFGAAALRRLLDRFVEAGASKFVVIPISVRLRTWLEELREAAIAPFEHQTA